MNLRNGYLAIHGEQPDPDVDSGQGQETSIAESPDKAQVHARRREGRLGLRQQQVSDGQAKDQLGRLRVAARHRKEADRVAGNQRRHVGPRPPQFCVQYCHALGAEPAE